VAFDAADAYQRFMGGYADLLSEELLRVLAPQPPQRVLDVGAGTGALTAPLAGLLGAGAVAAIEPSPAFVDALRARVPGVDVRTGAAEELPFGNGTFDLAIAQLVVHFMSDPVGGLREMARVTAPGGTVAASVWDFAGGRAPLSLYWEVARGLDPAVVDESALPGARDGDLLRLFAEAGLGGTQRELTVRLPYADPDAWWEPYTLGVGPVGDHLASLDDAHRAALRDRAIARLGAGPGVVEATAWLVVARIDDADH
jgi:SAM-dependent methyltransferase